MVIHHDQIPSPADKRKDFFYLILGKSPSEIVVVVDDDKMWMNVSKRLDVLAHHSNHQVEQTHGLDESETQNGVGEELATESRVAGNAHEESSEDETDTDTGTTETDGGGAHTQVLGDLDHGGGDLRGVLAAGSRLEGLAGVGLEEGGRGDTLGGTEGGDGGLLLGGEGALGGSVQLEAGSRASDLGGLGHGGSHARGEDTRGGHFV